MARGGTLSPALLVAAAGALLDGARAANSTARLSEQFLSIVDDPGAAAWNAAFIHHAGHWSHVDHCTGQSCWPLPATAECDELAEFARTEQVLSAEAPEAGEVFLLWSPSKERFVHTGIVLSAQRFEISRDNGKGGTRREARFECHTIEGNITSTGYVGGDRLARVRRVLSPARGDRTIRWTELEERVVSTRRRAA